MFQVEVDRGLLEGEGYWIVQALQDAKLVSSGGDKAGRQGRRRLCEQYSGDGRKTATQKDDLASESVRSCERAKKLCPAPFRLRQALLWCLWAATRLSVQC